MAFYIVLILAVLWMVTATLLAHAAWLRERKNDNCRPRHNRSYTVTRRSPYRPRILPLWLTETIATVSLFAIIAVILLFGLAL